MPFGLKPACISCTATSSSIWRKDPNGDILCHNCATNNFGNNGNGKDGGDNGSGDGDGNGKGGGRSAVGSHFVGRIRKSARLKPSKYRYQPTTRTLATKGKSRRVIFKKNVSRAANAVATVITTNHVYYNGLYHQIGDVMSLVDYDGVVYYAQLRGFLQDQYMQKSAVLTWLLPTTASPDTGFDPATFILGPEEDLPRKMDCMEFVCHAPTEYFKAKHAPYPTRPSSIAELGFIWTSLGPQIISAPSHSEIFGLSLPKPEPKEKILRERKEDKEKKEPKEKKEVKEKKELLKEKGVVKEKEVKKEVVKEKKAPVKENR